MIHVRATPGTWMRLSTGIANAPRPAERPSPAVFRVIRNPSGSSGTGGGSAVPASCGPVVPSRKSCGRHEPAGRPVAVVVPVRVGAGWRLAELVLRGGRGCAGAGCCRCCGRDRRSRTARLRYPVAGAARQAQFRSGSPWWPYLAVLLNCACPNPRHAQRAPGLSGWGRRRVRVEKAQVSPELSQQS